MNNEEYIDLQEAIDECLDVNLYLQKVYNSKDEEEEVVINGITAQELHEKNKKRELLAAKNRAYYNDIPRYFHYTNNGKILREHTAKFSNFVGNQRKMHKRLSK